jgi:hypothetical protein
VGARRREGVGEAAAQGAARATGFEVVEVQDISQSTMPNLVRLENLARFFFQFAIFGKIFKLLLPEYLAQNAIAGLLMPLASQEDILGYYRIILRRHN